MIITGSQDNLKTPIYFIKVTLQCANKVLHNQKWLTVIFLSDQLIHAT